MFYELARLIELECAYQKWCATKLYVPANPNDPRDENYARRRWAGKTLF